MSSQPKKETTVRDVQQEADYTEDFETVRATEHAWLKQRRSAMGEPTDAPLVGLALSGGGIRSAAFNLGVLQALARKSLLRRVDYLSSVSGGGYIASCLTWLAIHAPSQARGANTRFETLPLASGRGCVLDWLRAHGRYLITGNGLTGWSLAANILAGTLLNLFVLLPLFLITIAVASREWVVLSWPQALHLPGATSIHAHDGFILIALFGLVLLGLYLATMLLFALSTALPPVRRLATEAYFRRGLGQLLAGAIIAISIGLLPVATGLEEAAFAFFRETEAREMVRQLSWIAPMLTGGASMWIAMRRKMQSRALPIIGLTLVLYGGLTGLYHLVHHTAFIATPAFQWWLGGSLLLALLCDINAVSMHSYYRSRLAEAFLPAISQDDVVGTKHGSTFLLRDAQAAFGAPLQIINTTLNTTSSRNARLRSRNGENMALTPLYCGSQATGYRRTEKYLGGKLTLATAFAISGAAVDPDTYATNSRPISFLMTLLNVRLGVWTTNPRRTPRKFRWPAWYQLMLREMFGAGLSEQENKIHLSDGGHFENLGVYELLRRRCRYVVVSDAGADPAGTLEDLGKAVQRARADLGAEIDICADAFFNERDEGLATRSHLVGTVTYADGSSGEILYLKARLRKALSADVYAYWRTNPAFPNQPTQDQFYGELQFDSYRELGLQLMSGVIGEATSVEKMFALWRADEDLVALADREVA
jgi:predicted acylesterase/phospholipase RssA